MNKRVNDHKRCLSCILTAVISMLLGGSMLSAQTIFDEEHSLPYVHYLIESKQYTLAEAELLRLKSTYTSKDTFDHLLLYTYKSKNDDSALFGNIRSLSIRETKMNRPLAVYCLRLCVTHDSIQAAQAILNNSMLDESLKHIVQLHLYWYQLDTASAVKEVALLSLDTSRLCYPVSNITAFSIIKHKSPGLAAGMSAAIPGSGKVYSGQWKDGVISLVLVGLFTFQSYRGFNQAGMQSVYGWVFAGFATSFYAGNIYGSFRAAKRYNSHQLNTYRDEVKKSFMCAVY